MQYEFSRSGADPGTMRRGGVGCWVAPGSFLAVAACLMPRARVRQPTIRSSLLRGRVGEPDLSIAVSECAQIFGVSRQVVK